MSGSGWVDLYVLLGVDRKATKNQIRRAFRKLARKYHPDINPGDRVSATRYQNIHEAYLVLSDAERRAEYDRGGINPESESVPETPAYGFEGFDFSSPRKEFKESIREFFSTKAPPPSEGAVPGEDLHVKLQISFDDSMRGGVRRIELTRTRSCDGCLGWGVVTTEQGWDCNACGGTGRTMQARGHMLFAKPCVPCRGVGVISRARCPKCGGVGRFLRDELVEVTLQPGVADGTSVVLSGLGHEGRGGAPAGDLYVHLEVSAHPFFERKGDNLYCSIPVTFAEAALGAKLPIPTYQGPVNIRVPAGVQSGQQLRVSERGAPSLRGDSYGDLFVEIRVVTPRVYDERSRELLLELDRLNPLEPRKGLVDEPDSEEEKAG